MPSKPPPISVGSIINQKWRVCGELGSGTQGVVYAAVDIESGQHFAVKTQRINPLQSALIAEYRAYSTILQNNRSSNFLGIPWVYHYDEDEDGTVALMIMDKLGPTLTQLFAIQGGLFSRKTLLMLFKHILISIQNVHESGYIHRDIKPDNICMGRGEKAGFVHLIDFGISERYINEETGEHVKMVKDGSFSGTIKYASVHALSGVTSSRRDDLESVIYVMMYLWKGTLPFSSTDKHDIDMAIENSRTEKSRSVADICKCYPQIIQDLFSYVRNLDFDEEPDYVMMRGLVDNEFDEFGFKEDGYFDWFYTSDGDEVLSNPRNLDHLYDKISSLVHGELSSSDYRSVTYREAVEPSDSREVGCDDGDNGTWNKHYHHCHRNDDADKGSLGCLKRTLCCCTGSILKRMNTFGSNTNVASSGKTNNRKRFDDVNYFSEGCEERAVEQKNVVRGLMKKLARNKR